VWKSFATRRKERWFNPSSTSINNASSNYSVNIDFDECGINLNMILKSMSFASFLLPQAITLNQWLAWL
jgi:hypothetical protein